MFLVNVILDFFVFVELVELYVFFNKDFFYFVFMYLNEIVICN